MSIGTLSLIAVPLLTLMMAGGDGSGGAASPTPTSTLAASSVPQCAVAPAESNPPGGGGTPAQNQIDPDVYGRADMSKVTVFGFSQVGWIRGTLDPQIAEMVPDIVPRAWNRWDRDGLQPSDFNFQAPAAAHAQGTLFIGATTASVLFADEPVFQQAATCNAAGQLVPHRLNATTSTYYRASLASPAYQDYLVKIGEIQIDGGVDGLFFDEQLGTYNGATYDGNEGFDDANIADFGGYLCAKYPGLTADHWTAKFGIVADDGLDCSLSADKRGRGFNYRGYMARLGFQQVPMSFRNPLAAEWGWGGANTRVDLSSGSFTTTYANLVYWHSIVLRLRNYARQKYGREILITANGIFPFVDFQMPNMYEYNSDAPDGSTENYLPLSGGHFDGTRSWQPALRKFRQISRKLVGYDMPMTLFIDWPGQLMSTYYQLPLQERQDYMRCFTAESYSNSILFSLPLLTSMPGDPTADQLNMMGLFRQLRDFYKGHETLYHSGTDTGEQAAVAVANVMQNLVGFPDGSRVLHLVNHNYAGGFVTQTNVEVSFPMPQRPSSVTLASPDFPSDQAAAFTYAGGQVQVTIPQLVSYVAVHSRSPRRLRPPGRRLGSMQQRLPGSRASVMADEAETSGPRPASSLPAPGCGACG
jgi:hypothetical protein